MLLTNMCYSPKYQSKQLPCWKIQLGMWNCGQPNLATWPLHAEKATGCPLNVAMIQALAVPTCHSARSPQNILI